MLSFVVESLIETKLNGADERDSPYIVKLLLHFKSEKATGCVVRQKLVWHW